MVGLDLILFLFVCLAVPLTAGASWLMLLVRRKRSQKPKRGRLHWILTWLFLVEVLCISYGYLVEPHWLVVNHHTIPLPGLKEKLRLVQLSDLHLRGEPDWEAQVLEAVKAAAPDLVVLTGDYLNEFAHPEILRRFLDNLVAILGPERIFAITGNFEWDGHLNGVFAAAGIPLLDEVVVTFSRGEAALQLAGIGYRDQAGGEWVLRQLAGQIAPDVPAILLNHTPDLAESPGVEAFDLSLAGHTHGGQVRLPFYGALVTLSRFGKRYEAGLYRLPSGGQLFVNRGVGTEPSGWFRVRFLCRPEVAVFDLVPEQNQ